MAIRVEIEQESVTTDKKACVRVYNDDILVTEVTADVKPQKGADGGWYSSVFLTETNHE